jgi:hypothetical protein
MKIETAGINETLRSIDKAFEADSDKGLFKATSAMKTAMVAATPIDTGEARASWLHQKTATGYSLVNVAEHIQALNAGSSKQAPKWFIERTAIRFGTPVGSIVDKT